MTHEERLEAFDRLRAKHLRFLTAVLWRLSGQRELFAEALQYALLGMWRHVEKLGREDAPGYLYRIALSANAKAWRHRVGRDGALAERIDRDEEAGPAAGRTELDQAVRRALACLPVKQGRAIVMRYLQQKEYPDIANELGCSEATARSHVSKAVAALQKKLARGARWE